MGLSERIGLRPRILQVLVAGVAAATAFGCGGGGGSPAPTVTPQPTATPPATATVAPTGAPTPVLPTPGAGLQSSITDVTISSAGQIVVTFTLTDANGIPIQALLTSAQNDNQARVRFVIAHLEDYSGGGELGSPTQFTRYVNDINMTHPTFDSGGTLATLDPVTGTYQYTFKTELPAGFNPTLTYTVGAQIDRTYQGQELGANPIFDVVPAGGPPEVLQDVATSDCNHCHDPLIAHGNRREVRLCLLCHTEAATDNPPAPQQPESIDFRHMIHKIHAGQELPSVANGPPGSFYGIYSSYSKSYAIFAQKDADGLITGVEFPRTLEYCSVCHGSDAPTADYYMDRPSAEACATCHDDVNPSMTATAAGPPGTNHFQSRGYADGDCTFCHTPTGREFDISVTGAHTIPARSTQLQGLNLAITNVSNSLAGQTPIISFKVTDNEGNALTDLSGLNRIGFAIAGPTTDYATVMTPTAVGGGSSGTLTGPDDSGVFQYMPPSPIPANATGTWSVGAEARRTVTLTLPQGSPYTAPLTVTEAAPNPVVTFSVDNSTPMPHRTIVATSNCGNCHGVFSKDFSIHGGLRNQVEYCELCHNPNNSDYSQRKTDPAEVAAGAQVATIDFKVMIHKIHRGENLEQKPYIIYGYGGTPHDFSDVLFPGDLRDCAKCHVDSSYLMPPFPGTALPTQVAHIDPMTSNLVVDGYTGPIQSVCTACHDGEDAIAHAQAQTAPDGTESCPVCHEEGRDFAVSVLHAGRN